MPTPKDDKSFFILTVPKDAIDEDTLWDECDKQAPSMMMQGRGSNWIVQSSEPMKIPSSMTTNGVAYTADEKLPDPPALTEELTGTGNGEAETVSAPSENEIAGQERTLTTTGLAGGTQAGSSAAQAGSGKDNTSGKK